MPGCVKEVAKKVLEVQDLGHRILDGGMRRYKELLMLKENIIGSCEKQKMEKPLKNIRELKKKLRRRLVKPEGKL